MAETNSPQKAQSTNLTSKQTNYNMTFKNANVKEAAVADKASLIALDALMKIKNSHNDRNNTTSRMFNESSNNNMLQSSNTTNSLGYASHLMGVVPMGLLPQTTNTAAAFSSQVSVLQQAAVSRATAISAGMQQTIPYNVSANVLNQFVQANSQQSNFEISKEKDRLKRARDSQNPIAKDSTSLNDRMSDPSEETIRREKVEAALRSKPQRGRKRDNLSPLERLELTRTRNREHAKSTRIRKKARYQELLDCETRLQELAKQEELNTKRKESIKTFLTIREGGLALCQSQINRYENHSDLGSLANDSNNPKCPAQSVTFSADRFVNSKFQRYPADRTDIKDSLQAAVALDQVVEDVDNFCYRINGINSVSTQLCQPEMGANALDQFRQWDESVHKRVIQRFDADTGRSMKYRIVGNDDGIAVSNDNTAFARVELFLDNEQQTILLSVMLRAQYTSDSDQLISVEWSIAEDLLAENQQQGTGESDSNSAPSSSAETLGCQLVYPSVISLDHEKAQDACDNNGPGMDI